MSLRTDNRQLNELLQDFYVLTNIKIVIFDDNFKEILQYPDSHCDLCKIIRQQADRDACCESSNRRSFDECKQSGRLIIYRCHAGLIEATAPIKSNGVIIGYFMFGQITDVRDKDQLTREVLQHFTIAASDTACWQEAIHKVRYKSSGQIQAAAKILEALTFYVLQKDLIALRHERLIDKLNNYIEDHLSQPITAGILVRQFHISRTLLYEQASQGLGMGIARYILLKRLERAKTLLATADDSITKVAGQVGFDDPAYFTRVFRHEYKLSPSEYRKKYTGHSQP